MADEKKKNKSKVVNPHDKVFRETYSNKENARSLLANNLPDRVLKLVDLDSLEISKDSFIEKDLADYYSDILYQVMFKDGSQGFIYVLFEGKGKGDRPRFSQTTFFVIGYTNQYEIIIYTMAIAAQCMNIQVSWEGGRRLCRDEQG